MRQSAQTAVSAARALLLLVLAFPTVPAHSEERAAEPAEISDSDIPELLWNYVTIREPGVDPYTSTFAVRVVINEAGKVTSAKAENRASKFAAEAESLALAWEFEPYLKEGRALPATFRYLVSILPPERPTRHRIDFPTQLDRAQVRIVLERGTCYEGPCPMYSVQIDGDGTVVYNGFKYVAVEGKHRSRIPAEAVDRLLDKFRAADFFSLDDAYQAEITDNATFTVSLKLGKQEKRVIDYAGLLAGMPQAIHDIEDSIDRAANSDRWTRAAPGLVESLRAEGIDFQSDAAANALAGAAKFQQMQTLEALIREGVKPTGKVSGIGPLAHAAGRGNRPMIEALLAAGAGRAKQEVTDALWTAAKHGNLGLVTRFIEGGGDPKANAIQSDSWDFFAGLDGSSVLSAAVASCNPVVVEEILKHNPDIAAKDQRGRTAIYRLAETNRCGEDTTAPAATIGALMRAGAQLDIRDSDGSSQLMLSPNVALIQALLDAGAAVDFPDSYGRTPLQRAYSEEVALILIRAGADTTGRDSSGESILDRAQQKGWKKVIAELSKR